VSFTTSMLRIAYEATSIWRPYKSPVYDCPMALCDGSTVTKEDLLLCDNIQKSRLGETMIPIYSPSARWYYLNQQRPDEVLIIKIFDSKQDVKAPNCPHTAFYHSDIPLGRPARRSIEVRMLVFTYDQT